MNENKCLWRDRKHHLWFPISFTRYSIEEGRLIIHKGLIRSVIDETLLYRIVDLTMEQGLLGKLFGTGNIILHTKVDATPTIVLQNVSRPMETRRVLSQAIEEAMNRNKVVGKEFYSSSYRPDSDMDGGIEDQFD